ncbi:MAG: F0F1 ATP synthase subunit epsilon [Brevibacterium aurantiacum]|uniref:ATP synthase F1 subcomplex epsilon subunit n=1 Tax=Brevibacterium aurantiacum TaxID=273384 RepID=A0A2H1J9J4_BREAU|nr:F0F1 ATP synthase subunit epsilon [Brevibacterium aurantiacum]MDN5549493.1 F0F1 ATP synthase subunit epsilon [Brevibacterium sp.]MDN5609538.1 F0F1 ATP synthase subunit epsilon [Brevibacterium sp.]MDN5711008.1 F0F1 ATP synthase subunit epsilon [Brevibacterium aurantiacum]MDN5738494.1 F0F1 ATP synthase subunit epsilon [Brevibacterium aurantiacum]PCC49852.1 ATP synthase F1 subunit epsilon [Brevibacterium aurantiacum]
MAVLDVNVVAADQEVWVGEAKRVIARTSDGDIGILPGHEPVLGVVADGEARILTTSEETIRVKADGGFLSVENNRVIIAADQAELL